MQKEIQLSGVQIEITSTCNFKCNFCPVSGQGGIFPMPSRKDLMSLSTLTAAKDNMKTSTNKFVTGRSSSINMATNDIYGKLHNLNQI